MLIDFGILRVQKN